jgi:hypothetical protein
MELATTILLWVVGSIVVIYLVAAEFIDIIGRLEIVEKHWPKLWRALNNRPIRLVLLIFLVVLVGKDIVEKVKEPKIPPLVVNFAPPLPPIIQMVAAPANVSIPQKGIKIGIKQGDGSTANPGVNTAPVQQGPCSVFQNGGSNNSASTNCGPPDPRIEHFEVVPTDPISGANGNPRTAFRFTLSAPLGDQKFIAVCSRPCTAKSAIPSPPPSVILSGDSSTGGWADHPTQVAWVINIPMHADQFWIFTVESNDKMPVSIEKFGIAKFAITAK